MSGDETLDRALVDEALKKGALVWLQLDRAGVPASGSTRAHPRWYAWNGEHLYLVTGGGEQPDPGLVAGLRVRVVVRSKDTRHRLVTFDADVGDLRPQDDDWDSATTELVKARLNLAEPEHAARRWADFPYRLFRLTPALPLPEETEEEQTGSYRAAPPASPATTTASRATATASPEPRR